MRTQPARPLGRGALRACANGVAYGTRLGEVGTPGLVAGAFAQVVQVRDRQACQALIAGIAVHAPGAAQEVHNGWTTHIFIGAVHLYQQLDIGLGVLAGKGDSGGSVAFGQGHSGQPVLIPAGYQASDLDTDIATGAAQVGQHHAALTLFNLGIVKALEHAADVFVAIEVTAAFSGCEVDFGSGCQKFLQVRNRAQLCLVHVDHHPVDDGRA